MDLIDKLIKDRADEIRETIKGCNLYGRLIDPDNADMMIVAAWAMAEGAEIQRRINVREAMLG